MSSVIKLEGLSNDGYEKTSFKPVPAESGMSANPRNVM